MRRLHFRLTTADGRTLNTTPANRNPVLCERGTTPTETGVVLTDPGTSIRYLLTEYEPIQAHGRIQYYRLNLLLARIETPPFSVTWRRPVLSC